MPKKKQLLSFEEFLKCDWSDLRESLEHETDFDCFLDELQEKIGFIVPDDAELGWKIINEYEDRISLQHTDDDGYSKIHCFVYIMDKGVYVMDEAYLEQGEDYDDDLDEIVVTYVKRPEAENYIKRHIEFVYNDLAKEYKLYK